MRCREAEGAWRRSELGPLAPPDAAALARHLARCGPCRSWASAEARVSAALAALGGEAPASLDVTDRVAAAVAALAPRSAGDRRRAWAAAAAAAAALLAAAVGPLPALARLVPRGLDGAGALRPVLSALGRACRGLVAPWLEPLSAADVIVPALVRASAAVTRDLEPAVSAVAIPLAAAMMIAVAAVVVRDARRPAWSGPSRARGDG
jgi:hypothetical protein